MTTRRDFWLSLCCAAQIRAQDEPVFTADARDVPVEVAVTRSQRPLRGLRAEDFLMLENGQPQPIRAVTSEELRFATPETVLGRNEILAQPSL